MSILMSRAQANQAMADAIARQSGECGKCPPSSTHGGQTGSRPATGPSPSGGPQPRQVELHPRQPSAQIGQITGNTKCGPNSSQNIANNGQTGNGSRIPPPDDLLTTQPVSPYQSNPLERQDPDASGPCADAFGHGYDTAVQDAASGELDLGAIDSRNVNYPALSRSFATRQVRARSNLRQTIQRGLGLRRGVRFGGY